MGELCELLTAITLPLILLLYMLMLIAYLPYALTIDAYNMIKGRIKHLITSTRQVNYW